MNDRGADFFSRIDSLVQTFGAGALLAVVIVGLMIALVVFYKGTGLVYLLLFASYTVGLIQIGGVIYIATIVRWGCLVLLVLGMAKTLVMPRLSFLFFIAYAFLSMIYITRSPFPVWSFQLGMLLLLVVIGVPVSARGYLVSYEKIDTLFKMGIFSAAIWSISVVALGREFIYSSDLRLSGGSSVGEFAFSGAYFAPMVLWGIFQKKYTFWRIVSILLITPFVVLLFLTGVRTALFALVIIAYLPMFVMRGKRATTILTFTFLAMLIAAGLFVLYTIAPGKFDFLIGRVMSSESSGRSYLWAKGLDWCVSRSMIFGMGIGSAGASYLEFGYFHNAYLTIWYNSGFIGLIFVLCFLFIYSVRSFRLIRKSTSIETGDYARIAFGYMIGIIAASMFEGTISGSAVMSVFILLLITSLIDALEMLQSEDSSYFDNSLMDDYLYE